MKAIGLTGGIGSGKSTIARILKQMGFPVYIADTKASHLMNRHPGIHNDIVMHFGKSIYTVEGNIDKPLLAKLIFNNPDNLTTINQIVHPRVMEDFQQWGEQQTGDLIFFESAILFEAGLNSAFSYIICVTAPETIRINRVMARDKTTPEQVKARIGNQMDDSDKCRQSDFIIYNDDKHPVIVQILKIVEELKRQV